MSESASAKELAIKVAPMGVVGWLRNLVAWIFGVYAFFWGFWLTVGVALLAPFGLHRRFAAWCAGILIESIILLLGVKIDIRGFENIDPKQHYIIVANHRSWLDAVAIIFAFKPLKVAPVFVIKRGLLFFPVFGVYMWLAGYVPVDRGTGGGDRNKKSMEKAARHVNSGVTVLAFPEGTRAPTHKFVRFKKGAADLAIASKTPMLPIVISGSAQLFPKKTPFVRPGRMRLDILPPIPVKEGDTRDSLTKAAYAAITPHYRVDIDGPPLSETPELAARIAPPL